jgi:Lrp/AsnC family transcriptional regulator for asnA, asnC and gidA
MQIVSIVQPQELGWNEAAMIGISVQPDKINDVAEAIAQLPEIAYLFQAAGEFDLFAEVYCRDKKHFVTFLMKLQRSLSAPNLMILKMHKLSYRWGQAEPPQK